MPACQVNTPELVCENAELFCMESTEKLLEKQSKETKQHTEIAQKEVNVFLVGNKILSIRCQTTFTV